MRDRIANARAIRAFTLYALLGLSSNAEYRRIFDDQALDEHPDRTDLIAVSRMFERLDREGRDYVSEAVRAVYMFVPGGIVPSNIAGRVLSHAMNVPADVRTVYRWLAYAKRVFSEMCELTEEP